MSYQTNKTWAYPPRTPARRFGSKMHHWLTLAFILIVVLGLADAGMTALTEFNHMSVGAE